MPVPMPVPVPVPRSACSESLACRPFGTPPCPNASAVVAQPGAAANYWSPWRASHLWPANAAPAAFPRPRPRPRLSVPGLLVLPARIGPQLSVAVMTLPSPRARTPPPRPPGPALALVHTPGLICSSPLQAYRGHLSENGSKCLCDGLDSYCGTVMVMTIARNRCINWRHRIPIPRSTVNNEGLPTLLAAWPACRFPAACATQSPFDFMASWLHFSARTQSPANTSIQVRP